MILEIKNLFSDTVMKVYPFTIEDVKNISFLIENDSNEEFYRYVSNKVENYDTGVDLFFALLKARMVYINEKIVFKNNDSNISIALSLWIEEFLKNLSNFEKVVIVDDYEILLSYPKYLLYFSEEDILKELIQYIKVDNKTLNFRSLSLNDKQKMLNLLPPNVVAELFTISKTLSISNNILLMAEKTNLPNIEINFFDNSAFLLLRTLFNYYDYDNLLEMIFILSKRMSDLKFLMSQLPKDLDFFMKLYSEEVEKMNTDTKVTI